MPVVDAARLRGFRDEAGLMRLRRQLTNLSQGIVKALRPFFRRFPYKQAACSLLDSVHICSIRGGQPCRITQRLFSLAPFAVSRFPSTKANPTITEKPSTPNARPRICSNRRGRNRWRLNGWLPATTNSVRSRTDGGQDFCSVLCHARCPSLRPADRGRILPVH